LQAGDWVGVFFEDDGVLHCAGAVVWTDTANLALVANGNDTLESVKNGFAENELVQWKFYRDDTSEEECVKAYNDLGEEFTWANGDLDVVDSFGPCVEPPVCQTINLSSGFQFISSYIQPENPDMLDVMSSVLEDLDYVVNSNGQQLVEFFGSWQNGIGNWINEEGYLVKMNNASELEICGEKLDPQTEISLNLGFQFVSYFDDQPQDALLAFGGILDNLDYAVNSSGQQLVEFFGSWQNGIGDLNPGEGYLLRMNGDDVLQYPPTEQGMSQLGTNNNGANSVERGVYWPTVQGDPSDGIWDIYVFDATFDGVSLEAGDELAIFDGDLLVGSMVMPGTPPGEALCARK